VTGSSFGTWNGVELHEFVPGVNIHAVGGEQVLAGLTAALSWLEANQQEISRFSTAAVVARRKIGPRWSESCRRSA